MSKYGSYRGKEKAKPVRRYKATGGPVHNYSFLQGFEGGGTATDEEYRDEGAPPTPTTPYPTPVDPATRANGLRALSAAMADSPRGPPVIDRPTSTSPDRPATLDQRFASSAGIPLPRARPENAPQAEEIVSAPAALPRPAGQAYPAPAAAPQQQAGPAMDPSKAMWSDIMNTLSPMFRDANPQRKTMREILTDPRSRGDFLTRFGANVLGANPAHGWGSTIGQGLSGTIGTFDKFANEDLSARQKAQSLAAQIKKHTETLGEHSRHNRSTEGLAQQRLDQDNWRFAPFTTQSGRPIRWNSKTGETVDGITGDPIDPADKIVAGGRGAGAGRPLAIEIRRQMAGNIFPNDPILADALAMGQIRTITPDLRLRISNAVTKEWNDMLVKPRGVTESDWKKNKEQELVSTIGQFAAPSPSMGGASAPAPVPAASSSPIDKARAAIAAGANKDAVIKRLKDSGIDPSGL